MNQTISVELLNELEAWLQHDHVKRYLEELSLVNDCPVKPYTMLDDGNAIIHRDLVVPFMREQDLIFQIFCDKISTETALPEYLKLYREANTHDFDSETPRDL